MYWTIISIVLFMLMLVSLRAWLRTKILSIFLCFIGIAFYTIGSILILVNELRILVMILCITGFVIFQVGFFIMCTFEYWKFKACVDQTTWINRIIGNYNVPKFTFEIKTKFERKKNDKLKKEAIAGILISIVGIIYFILSKVTPFLTVISLIFCTMVLFYSLFITERKSH